MATVTCPYCTNPIQQPVFEHDQCFCSTCNAYVHYSQNGRSKCRYKLQKHMSRDVMNMDLPELMELHSYDLSAALIIAKTDENKVKVNQITGILEDRFGYQPQVTKGTLMKFLEKCTRKRNKYNAKQKQLQAQ